MAATYVTKAELRTNLGIGALYTDAVVEEVCQAAEDIIKAKLYFNKTNVTAYEATGTTGTLYFDRLIAGRFYVGQTITVENVAAHFNGTHTSPRSPIIHFLLYELKSQLLLNTKSSLTAQSSLLVK
jgi:hypothetical protein